MKRSELKFNAGSILRKEMLQDLYEYPRVAIEGLYSEYSDGILYGLSWKEKDDKHHIICPGALKFQGKIYFLKEDIDIEDKIGKEIKVNSYYRLCFVLQEVERTIESKTDYCLKLFALQSSEYNQLQDKAFWYAYINYSGEKKIKMLTNEENIKYGVPGLFAADDGFNFKLPNWLVKQHIFDQLESKKNKHPLDYLLLREIYASKAISVSFINLYLNELEDKKLNSDCTPQMALEMLCEAVNKLIFQVSITNNDSCEKTKVESPNRGGLL